MNGRGRCTGEGKLKGRGGKEPRKGLGRRGEGAEPGEELSRSMEG